VVTNHNHRHRAGASRAGSEVTQPDAARTRGGSARTRQGGAVARPADGRFDAGEVVEFRIAHQRVDLRPGDYVEVSLRYGESDTEIQKVNATVVSS